RRCGSRDEPRGALQRGLLRGARSPDPDGARRGARGAISPSAPDHEARRRAPDDARRGRAPLHRALRDRESRRADERGVGPRGGGGPLARPGAAAHEEPAAPALRAPWLRARAMAGAHRLAADQVHYEWNNALSPRLTIDPGDTVSFATRAAPDACSRRAPPPPAGSGGGPSRAHPRTGPARMRGAAPGDTLVVEVLEMEPAADFGWTAIRPGRGLLPEAEFSKPHLVIWDVSDGAYARMGQHIAVPLAPFPRVMGTALAQPRAHTPIPPPHT